MQFLLTLVGSASLFSMLVFAVSFMDGGGIADVIGFLVASMIMFLADKMDKEEQARIR